MIVLDIETSGVNYEKSGIWQIGALDLNNPENTFLEESRIDESDVVSPEALKIIGKTEEYLRDSKKQSQKQLIENFFSWFNKIEMKNCICQHPHFDLGFIIHKVKKYNLPYHIKYRSFDLHTLTAHKYFQINNKFFLGKDGTSGMNLPQTIEFCGMKDPRLFINMETSEVERPGKPHNALEDAKLTAECFSRIVHGRILLSEYEKFPIPKYLVT
tara:strand:+ start:1714 stop:2355 length:642 start_codon:yes stop_codon:yes gene_type:complete